MEKVRGSFYCSICDWRNHTSISPETMTIHLDYKFQEKFTLKYGKFLKALFSTALKHALYLDEFVELISNYRLIRYNADRGILHKYKIIVEGCATNPKMCSALMREFNLNKFTYMFDGTEPFIKDFLSRYTKILDMLTDPKKINKLFKRRTMAF